jgi:hypothetical protein
VQRAPGFPCSLFLRGTTNKQNSGCCSRENVEVRV